MRIGPQPRYVDEARAGRNRVVIEPPRTSEMRDRADKLRRQGGAVRAMRADAAVATCGIITFGAAAQPIFEQLDPVAQDAAYRDVAERIADECGTTVRGLVVHADEAAPHAHVIWDARSSDGAAMSKVMKGSRLQDIAADVMSQHAPGIVRGERKTDRIERGDDASAVYHRSVQELHHDLPHELEELRADRDAAAARLEKNERLAEKARRAAEGDDAKAEKARKRAETYEKRATDAQAEVARLDARSAALRSERSELDARSLALDDQADEIAEERDRLADVRARVEELIGSVADRLGVGADLRAIRDVLSDVGDPFQAPDNDAPDNEM
jgi:hypothetical protein